MEGTALYKLSDELEIFRPEIGGRVAIVTGGSTGIGSETVKTLAALGAEVHFCGRNVEAGKAVEALFPEGNAHFAKVDVAKPKELERWIKRIPVVDFMVNNVADDTRVPWDEIDVDAIERAFAVNLRSHFLAIHAALPAVRKGTGKSIVIMGTSNWMRPEANCILYNVMKSGIVGLTHALAREFGPEFIRVNTFTPGWIATPKQLKLNMHAA
jgi:NAD(P)-dependent dehydrogenase (short-subunit alcohol dehydrogenase family)